MTITVGHFALELSIEHGRFLGIGSVHYGSTPLRSPQLPWTCYTESDHGSRFANLSRDVQEEIIRRKRYRG